MADLYTHEGRPLTVRGDDIFDRDGQHVGRRNGAYVYDPEGNYAATIQGDRVSYRSTDSARVASPFAETLGPLSGQADRAASGLWGEEPFQ